MITYRATLDVSRELVLFVAGLLAAERRRRGTPKGSRALTCYWQAVLGVRWFRGKTEIEALARDHGISRATGYRYVDEVIGVLAAEAPELPGRRDRLCRQPGGHGGLAALARSRPTGATAARAGGSGTAGGSLKLTLNPRIGLIAAI